MAAHNGFGDGPLEDRLRNLILNNSKGSSPHQTQDAASGSSSQHSMAQAITLPVQDGFLAPSSPGTTGGPASSKTARKRPNQAQRRQMSAQLSIPIDPRPQFPQPQRSYASPPGYLDQQQQQQQHGRGGYRRTQPPHSATFRPPSRDNATPSASLTSAPFPPRSRHQPSLSYHGPMSRPNQYGWPSSPQNHPDSRIPYQMPGIPPVPFDAPASMHRSQHSSELKSSEGPLLPSAEELMAQSEMLQSLCDTIVADAEIETAGIMEKENFRLMIEQVARSAIAEYETRHNGFSNFPAESVQLKCFGSLASGFATKASDMDLGLLSPLSRVQPDAPGSLIPRLVEKAFLDMGLGARLLAHARVPIIKVCEKPSEELRQALLAERAKWERGGHEDGQDDEAHDSAELDAIEDQPNELHIQQQQDALTSDGGELDATEAQTVLEDQPNEPDAQPKEMAMTTEEKLCQLQQMETSSLSSYYTSAKRLLRKLGGRDITRSNRNEFETADIILLNQVCLAFVDGLADKALRDRLLRYQSLNRYDLSHGNNLRTLLGVLNQVEGEMLASLWDSRPFQERDRPREAAAENIVRAWRAIQDRPDFGRDPLAYQKELHLAVDQLKKIASIQVMVLSQGPNETPGSYCSRAMRLLHELGGNDSRERAEMVLPILIEHYIGGISDRAIREEVRDFQQAHRINRLQTIGRRHKSLQLAHEYEVCLARGVYENEAAATVRQYVELLRAPIVKSAAGHTHGMIPLPPSSTLLSDIRRLGDPSRAAPNRPRDRYSSALEFPKSGVGVQCDINFSAHLAVQNTLLLRCYSHCDPRVRPLILFVKHWAKVRRINSSYRGTLSSYGYTLMMLHYLVNIAQPFVCPNLQQLARPPAPNLSPQQIEETISCKGRNIQFWRDEAEIIRLARDNALTQNRESVGELLRGFFEYYAKGGSPMTMLPCRSFDWGRDVISLRTHGGLLTKQAKGWTGAKTVLEGNGVPTAPGEPSPTSPPHPLPGRLPRYQHYNHSAEQPTQQVPGQNAQQQQQQQQAGDKPPTTAAAQSQLKEVRHRYLFAIEDPFELDHNVARTVTHDGIVHIRDEFRRAWRIIRNAGRGGVQGQGRQQQQQQQQQGVGGWRQESLLEDVADAETEKEREAFNKLLEELHGVPGGVLDVE
ncbi:hypothetical protein C7999DRAFT_35371 [Corynascus novoguineensis]|uniref:polynucleotide adenylyltransferase n=1 Tax=Corynascus novoguineensis TaxID=1126955 RepID=A0AAN7CN41_9PEZI|nr:hypothetical protein C7999DRAFT_35371 [Corynascus novoguineensis]